jgi:Outer membrane protein beta-barrel domain
MRATLLMVALTVAVSTVSVAQEWEVGATGGYGWYDNTSIGNPALGVSARAGFHSGAAAGAFFGQNMYEYVGGELRYLYLWSSPELQYQNTRATIHGNTNLVVYDFLFHLTSRDSKVRPYFAAGAGIKVFTGNSNLFFTQPLQQFAVLAPQRQVEAVVSAGGGIKFLPGKHVLVRADFRTYMSPLPDRLFVTPRFNDIRGWVFNFVPQVGVGYTF